MLLVGWYVATSLSFAVPEGDPYKAATGSLRELARPYFAQSWNVFAPNILKSDIELEIRGQWRDASGELVHGPWFSVTRLELEAVAGMPWPARTGKQSWNLIQAYNERFLELDPAQRDFVQDSWIAVVDDGFAALGEQVVIQELIGLGDRPAAVRDLVRYDAVMVEFATYLATAYYGEEIERVRWRVVYDKPNDFSHRAEAARQFPVETRAFGWREAVTELDGHALRVVEEFVARNRGDG